MRPDLCAQDNPTNPKKYLGSFYTDSLVHDPLALKLLTDVIGKVSQGCHLDDLRGAECRISNQLLGLSSKATSHHFCCILFIRSKSLNLAHMQGEWNSAPPLFFLIWLRWVFVASCGPSLVSASGATLHCSVQASHCSGFSCCGARGLGTWAQ